MISNYETTPSHPPLSQFPKFAKALGVSVNQLLGVEKAKEPKVKDTRLRRLIAEVEKLPVAQRKEVARYLDTFLKAWKNVQGKS
jgi:hypothetical protein